MYYKIQNLQVCGTSSSEQVAYLAELIREDEILSVKITAQKDGALCVYDSDADLVSRIESASKPLSALLNGDIVLLQHPWVHRTDI